VKSIENIGNYPAGVSLVADDLVEFHAARILLLLRYCSQKDRAKKRYKIEGLTKLAKLDFFVRYPEFFRKVVKHLKKEDQIGGHTGGVESRMIRFHYGPWDERYYHILPFLESRGLISIEKSGNSYLFFLSESGERIADELSKESEYIELNANIKDVNIVLGDKTGGALKSLVYEIFGEEVSEKNLGEVIK